MGKKGKLGILGASLLAGTLAFGKEAYAQQTPGSQLNRIYSRNAEYSASGEGILLKDFVPYDISDSVNLKDFGLYARRGNLSYDAIDTRKGLENAVSFLRRKPQTGEVRASISYLQRLSQSISETDVSSLEALRRAVADEVITPQEISGVKPGTYIIIARSSAMQGYGSQSLPILVNIRSRQRPQEQRPAPVPYIPPSRKDTLHVDTIPRARPVYAPRQPRSERHGREKPSVRLTLDGFAGEEEMIGAGIGLGYGTVGLSFNYSQAGDRTVGSATVPLSNGRIGTGTKEEKDFKSLGANAELHLGPIFAGGGLNFGNYTTMVKENIISAEGDTLATNTNSRADSKLSYRLFGGAELPLNSRIGLRVFAGYDSRNGAWGGLGGRFRLNKK